MMRHLEWPLDALPIVTVAARFPLDQRRHEKVYCAPTIALHLHEVAGVLRRDGQDEPFAAGDLVVSFAHGATSYAQEAPQRLWCIHFEPPRGGMPTAAIPARLSLGPHRASVAARMSHVAQLHALSRGDALVQSQASAAMLEFLLMVASIARQPASGRHARGDAAASAAAEWIAAHALEPLAVPALARRVGLSQHALSRRFRLLFGDSMQGYQIRCRIAQARLMLAHGTTSLRTLARDLGFADIQHFSRHFRRHTGLPPGTYRDRHASA